MVDLNPHENGPGTLVRSIEGRIGFWSDNMEDLYGFSSADAIGKTPRELLKPIHWQAFEEIEASFAAHQVWNGGFIAHKADGQPVIVGNTWLLHAQPAEAGDRVTEVHYGLAEPGTRSGAQLADVLAAIAQELSQPLTAASAYLAGAQRVIQPAWPERHLADAGLSEALEQIQRAVAILQRIRTAGENLRDSRLRDVHDRLMAASGRSTEIAQDALRIRQESGRIIDARRARRSQPSMQRDGAPTLDMCGHAERGSDVPHARPSIAHLPARDVLLLRSLSSGRPLAQIAAEQGIPPRALAFREFKLMERCGLTSRTALVAFAAKNGLAG